MRGLFEGAVYSEGANYSRKYGMYYRIMGIFVGKDLHQIPFECIDEVFRQIDFHHTTRGAILYTKNSHNKIMLVKFLPPQVTVFPRIDRARTIYFSALIGARTNRGCGLLL